MTLGQAQSSHRPELIAAGTACAGPAASDDQPPGTRGHAARRVQRVACCQRADQAHGDGLRPRRPPVRAATGRTGARTFPAAYVDDYFVRAPVRSRETTDFTDDTD